MATRLKEGYYMYSTALLMGFFPNRALLLSVRPRIERPTAAVTFARIPGEKCPVLPPSSILLTIAAVRKY